MPTGKGPLRIAIEDFLEGFGFFERFKKSIEAGNKAVAGGSVGSSWHVIMAQLGADAELPELLSNKSPHAVLGAAALVPMLLGALIGLGFSFISIIIQPFAMLAQYSINRKWFPYRMQPAEASRLTRLTRGDIEKWRDYQKDLGLDETMRQGYDILNIQRLTALNYMSLWRREEISDEQLHDNLIKLWMEDNDIELLKSLTQLIPPPSDLITMAVKEAFSEDFISRFQTDEGLPEIFVEWAGKQGISREWARRYWIQHWQLPSPQQVFEMLHRLRPGKSETPVTAEIVSDYLKAADYAPYWRDKLMAISYSPFTRVDIRRMYKVGVLTEDQVKEAYKDIGYDEEKAQALTEFTIAYEAEEETGIVRGSVLSAYGDGMIDRATAETMLKSSGYDETTIAFYLNNVDFKETLEVNRIKLANIKKKYLEGLIDETNVNSEINLLNLPAERVNALLELWTTERENQTALLTLTQMEILLERKIVSEDDYKRIASRRGYNDESINWTLQRIALEASERAQKDAEKAENDNERLQKSKTTSQYQKDKSEIDLAIAQAKAEITDIDVALHGDIDEVQAGELIARKSDLKIFISQMNVAKAQLRFDTTTSLNKLAG